jgi:chemotaxis protein MotB
VSTDTRRFATNWELSTARATQVVRALAESGINPDAVRLSATGFGEFSPVRPNDSDAGRAENRRIQLRLFYGTGQATERDSSAVL